MASATQDKSVEVVLDYLMFPLLTATLNLNTGSITNVGSYDPEAHVKIEDYSGKLFIARPFKNGVKYSGKLETNGNGSKLVGLRQI